MIFLLSLLVSCQEFSCNLNISSVVIQNSVDSGLFQIKYNDQLYNLPKDTQVVLTGETTSNTIVISLDYDDQPLNLIFSNLHIYLGLETPLSISGKCQVNILLATDVELLSNVSDGIIVGENCILSVESANQNNKKVLNIYCGSTGNLINSKNSQVTLNNIILESISPGGVLGESIVIENSSLIFNTTLESIGGDQCHSINISNSYINVLSRYSTCIGNRLNETLNVHIFNSNVTAIAEREGAAIGNIQLNGTLSIIESTIIAKTSATQFSSIGFFGNIQILGSVVNSSAYGYAAIGGGVGRSEMNMTIKKSSVVGFASGDSAAIGGSRSTSISLLVIESTVKADNDAKYGRYGAGIGGGRRGTIKKLIIKASNVSATTVDNGSPIGGGGEIAFIDYIEISDHSYAYGHNSGSHQYSNSAIGGYYCDTINITDATISAHGGAEGCGIGGGPEQDVRQIIIERSKINATSGSHGAAIGGSVAGVVKDGIFIRNSDVFAFSGFGDFHACGAAIGGGYYTQNHLTVIENSNVTAIAGYYGSGAGIGGGIMASAGQIFIYHSNVYARSSLHGHERSFENNPGAGIGQGGTIIGATGGYPNRGGFIRILDSNISAFGGNIKTGKYHFNAGSAIGYGGITCNTIDEDKALNIEIKRSTIFAFGGNSSDSRISPAPALYGGDRHLETLVGNITLEDSIIYATSGYNSAFSDEEVNDKVKSIIGLSFNPSEEKTGSIYIKNCSIFAKHQSSDKFALPIITHNLTIDSDLELHSSFSNAFNTDIHSIKVPIVTLSNSANERIEKVRIVSKDTKSNFSKLIDFIDNDKSVTFTTEKEGDYIVYITKNGSSKDDVYVLENVKIGFNQFDLYPDQIPSQSQSQSSSSSLTSDTQASEIPTDNPNKGKKQNVALIIGLCVGVPFAIGIIIIVIAVLILNRLYPKISISEKISPGIKEPLKSVNDGLEL
ncbi:hypothetical protein TRFO_11378 [Tritrichomonas foetus]|uniref:Uncharacterized protein n=1 Tax=Tritrichomonas foetus TaxID=1144522 RepID=A0A1J4J417_9EUKA|nr:hypothetical protein TRFO_11378 [Tritrichomonas foetus]|eukprot:OHS94106.1 hypothetical protein TRFO_11378 [Tritrichomonas foetus]